MQNRQLQHFSKADPEYGTRVGEAIVQTYSPSHPAIVYAATHDYAGFAARETNKHARAG